MNCSILLGATAAFLMTVMPAFAVGLTEGDHGYLATQNIERSSPIIGKMSPKERARLHAVINDPRTENNPAARAKAVHETLKEFETNQHWETINPGQLWDAPKGKIAK